MYSVLNEDNNGFDSLLHEVAQGLRYTHTRINLNINKILETTSFLYALIELLNEKGLLTIEELDERKNQVAERLVKKFMDSGIGLMYQDLEYDKYNFKDEVAIDCENRVHICKVACCKLPFALSKQDIREGIIRWELGQPYMINQNEDGYCSHLDCKTHGCAVYTNRPVPCRAFDCSKDKRIWLNFNKKIINPIVNQPDWPQCLSKEEKIENQNDK